MQECIVDALRHMCRDRSRLTDEAWLNKMNTSKSHLDKFARIGLPVLFQGVTLCKFAATGSFETCESLSSFAVGLVDASLAATGFRNT
eukprot:scaffold220117_cov50-Prasinocladus_malaysianus.AAC.2